MFGKRFYDIPVYRLPEQKYESDLQTYIELHMLGKEGERESRRLFYDNDPERKLRVHNHLWKNYGGAWQFNEIIGYIRLYFSGSQVLGDYWQIDAKRIVKTRRKRFVWITYKIVPERDIPADSTNQEIYEIIMEYLSEARSKLKNRFVDTTLFETIGPFLDWRGVYENS